MKFWKRWKEYRQGALVTVCWLDEGISAVQWTRGANGKWECRGSTWRSGRSCNANGYRKSLSQLSSGGSSGRVRVRWMVLSEAYPGIPESGTGRNRPTLAVPAWMNSCWEELTERELPESLVSGTEALSGFMREWAIITDSGSGYLQLIGSRLVLIAHGSERLFRRVSRKDLFGGPAKEAVAREWLLQSRTLFRNRTGMDLKRVVVSPSLSAVLEGSDSRLPVEIINEPDSARTLSSVGKALTDGSEKLHASAARNRLSALVLIDLPALNQRKCWFRWESRLRFGSCLLLGCWGLMLLGACRHEAIVPDMRPEQATQMVQYRHQLLARQEKWQRSWVEKRNQARPFQLVSTISESLPEGIEVSRFRLAPAEEPGSDGVYLTLEGKYSGERNTRTLRTWIKDLQESPHIHRIENLRLARKAGEITFSMDGHSGNGGDPR